MSLISDVIEAHDRSLLTTDEAKEAIRSILDHEGLTFRQPEDGTTVDPK